MTCWPSCLHVWQQYCLLYCVQFKRAALAGKSAIQDSITLQVTTPTPGTVAFTPILVKWFINNLYCWLLHGQYSPSVSKSLASVSKYQALVHSLKTALLMCIFTWLSRLVIRHSKLEYYCFVNQNFQVVLKVGILGIDKLTTP